MNFIKNKKSKIWISLALILAGCGVMALADGVFKPDYFIKSIIKAVMFLLLPCFFMLFAGISDIKKLFTPVKRVFLPALLLGICAYIIILAAYFSLRGVFDFSGITGSLTENVGVSRDNFIFVAIYISLVNSLLEEFFFRGFAFLVLKNLIPERIAFAVSSLSFALYHIAIMSDWVSPILTTLLILGLAAAGAIFNMLDRKGGSILPSYLLHMSSNLATNTVGLILFGII